MNRDWGRTHEVSDPFSCAVQPPFIPEPLLILPDGFVSRHVLLIYPFVIAIGVPLPLDQVLSGLLPPIVAYIQNLLDFVFFLIGDEVGGRALVVPSMERGFPVWGKEVNVEHWVNVPSRGET